MSKVYIATDHAGFALKAVLISYIGMLGYEVEDLGAHELTLEDDYPDFITPAARAVTTDSEARGVVIGASGQGEAMCANRIFGVRAAVYYGEPTHTQTDADGHTLTMIESERAHNNANILSLGARFLSEEDAKHAVRLFLETPFSGESRHVRRLAKF